jgi:replication factor C subunit 2/4
VTRFVLICNYVSRIIEPLASRCVKFRFKPLHADPMRAQLLMIAAKERVALAPGCVEAILRVSGGDMRKAITTLQSAQALFVNAATGAVTAKAKAAAAVAAAGDADAEMGEAAAGSSSSSSSAAAAEGVEGVAAAEIEAVSGVIPEAELDASSTHSLNPPLLVSILSATCWPTR